MDIQAIVVAVLAMAAGGILKGATGAGAPFVVIPVLALLYDVPFAIAVFAFPNLLSNIWQGLRFRAFLGRPHLWLAFAVGGAAGSAVGSFLLVSLDPDLLALVLALVILVYIAFRLMRPDWTLPRSLGEKLSGPVGLIGGVFYGAIGLSAPISVTFINAMQLRREEFIATVSMFFFAMGVTQVPILYAVGVLDAPRTVLSVVATLALVATMPIGDRIARHLSPAAFDRLIMVLLGAIAIRILYGQFA